MSFNLVDAAKGLFTNELVGKASSFLGESEGGVTKAIGGILPSLISGMVGKAGTNDGAATIANLAAEQHNGGVLGSVGNFFGNDGGGMLNKGAGLLSGLFGDKVGGLTSLLSNFAGLRSSSITSLLSMAAPAILGLLGKHAATNNMGTSGIASLLSSQKDNVAAAMPAGLNLSSIFGNATTEAKTAVHNTTQYAEETVEKTGGALKMLLPLLLLALAGMAAWYFFKDGCNKPAVDVPAIKIDSPVIKKDTGVVATIVNTVKESFKVKLADGVEIEAYKGGIEDKLVSFLNDKAVAIDTANGNWFDFDNLNFDLGKSTITKESMVQVNNLIAILKAYPAAKIKVGGYTDKKGDDKNNLTLSQSRADAVFAALKAGGANAAQLVKAEGYGEKFAKIAETATDEERRTDRRTAVKVSAK
jgi:outer membrane protein OmpA-like peptidoglycan-associated protein